MNARLKELPAPPLPKYDAERREELRLKYAEEPEPNDWQDDAANDAGIPRFGEI